MLTQTGVAGKPDSHFHRPDLSAWARHAGLENCSESSERVSLSETVRRIVDKGSADTGVFGLRMQRGSFDFFIEKLGVLHPAATNDVDRIDAAFGKTLIIHLTRRDKVEQAISYVKAGQTGLWHAAPDGTEIERQSPPADPTYDSEEILARCNELSALDREWTQWFSNEGIEPITIVYEKLAADPIDVLRRLLKALGLDSDAAFGVVPGIAKLADATNKDWAGRFRAEHKQI